MNDTILKFLYRNPVSLITLAVVFVFFGVILALDMPLSVFPNTSKPIIKFQTTSGTLSAETYRHRWGEQIESNFRTLRNVENVKAEYKNGSTEYEVEFDWGTNFLQALADLQTAYSGVSIDIPEEWRKPTTVFKIADARSIYAIRSSKYNLEELTKIFNTEIVPVLSLIDGVFHAEVESSESKILLIDVDSTKLNADNLNFLAIQQVLEDQRYDLSLGEADSASGILQYSVAGKVRDIESIKSIKIYDKNDSSKTVSLGDIASVKYVTEKNEVIYRGDGENVLLLFAQPEPNADIKKVADEVYDSVQSLLNKYNGDITLTSIRDPSFFISKAIVDVLVALILTVIISSLVVMVFLEKKRSFLFVLLSIPISIVGGVFVLDALGKTINLISLGAFALAVGMLVDAPVVVVDAIEKELEKNSKVSVLDIVVKAVSSVHTPILLSLVTSIIVFLPLVFMQGIEKAILSDLAIVVVVVLATSYFVSIFILPAIGCWLYKFKRTNTDNKKRKVSWVKFCINVLENIYIACLKKILRYRLLSIGFLIVSVVAFFASTWLIYYHVDKEIIGKPGAVSHIFFANLKKESSVQERVEILADVEQQMLDSPFFNFVLTQHDPNRSLFICYLKDFGDADAVDEWMNGLVKENPYYSASHFAWNSTQLEIPEIPNIEIDFRQADDESSRAYGRELIDSLYRSNLFSRIESSPSTEKKTVQNIQLDDNQIAILRDNGNSYVTREYLESSLRHFIEPQYLHSVRDEGRELQIKLSLDYTKHREKEDLNHLLLPVNEDAWIPVRSLASLQSSKIWTNYFYENGVQIYSIKAWLKPGLKMSQQEIENKVQTVYDEFYSSDNPITFLQPDKKLKKSFTALIQSLILALVLVWCVIGFKYHHFSQMVVVMSSIPFAITGAGFAMYLFSSTFSLNSLLGMILLFGTSVNNAILILDTYVHNIVQRNQLDAIIETARQRFRPILVTSLSTILGMCAIVFNPTSSAKVLKPLGFVVSGGLLYSTLLTLFLVPVMLLLFAKKSTREEPASEMSLESS